MVRGHWSAENQLHWCLDVSFKEDQRRLRTGHGVRNFSRLCRLALNLLKAEKSVKVGIATKRLNCGWNHDYLIKVMMNLGGSLHAFALGRRRNFPAGEGGGGFFGKGAWKGLI